MSDVERLEDLGQSLPDSALVIVAFGVVRGFLKELCLTGSFCVNTESGALDGKFLVGNRVVVRPNGGDDSVYTFRGEDIWHDPDVTAILERPESTVLELDVTYEDEDPHIPKRTMTISAKKGLLRVSKLSGLFDGDPTVRLLDLEAFHSTLYKAAAQFALNKLDELSESD